MRGVVVYPSSRVRSRAARNYEALMKRDTPPSVGVQFRYKVRLTFFPQAVGISRERRAVMDAVCACVERWNSPVLLSALKRCYC